MLKPRTLLHMEGLAVLALSAFAYARMDASWLWFALLSLVPDLFMVGYLFNPRVGAFTYNLAHTCVGPLLAFGGLLGYGLKSETAFQDTHPQRVS